MEFTKVKVLQQQRVTEEPDCPSYYFEFRLKLGYVNTHFFLPKNF